MNKSGEDTWITVTREKKSVYLQCIIIQQTMVDYFKRMHW